MAASSTLPAYVPARLRARALDLRDADPDPSVVTDEYGRIVHASPAACELLAASVERLVGKLLMYRIGAESRAAAARVLASLRAGHDRASASIVLRSFRGQAFNAVLDAGRSAGDGGPLFVIRLRNTVVNR